MNDEQKKFLAEVLLEMHYKVNELANPAASIFDGNSVETGVNFTHDLLPGRAMRFYVGIGDQPAPETPKSED